jgi:hypothetical protein
MRLSGLNSKQIEVRSVGAMRTFLGLVGIAALIVIGVLAWNWWAGNNAQISVIYPTQNAELSGNTVPVRLAASPALAEKLNSAGDQLQIITYLDGKEVGRGNDLTYNLTAVPPGQHRLEIGLSDRTNSNSVSLSVMPTPVSFTLGGGSGAANALPGAANSLNGVYGNQPSAPNPDIAAPVATATPVANQVPAAPAPTQAPVQVPASGMGGGASAASLAQPASQAAVQSANAPQAAVQPGADDTGTARQAALAGNQTSLSVSATRPNYQAVSAAETAKPAPPDNQMAGVFRGIFAFNIAGFMVGLGALLFFKRRRGKLF